MDWVRIFQQLEESGTSNQNSDQNSDSEAKPHSTAESSSESASAFQFRQEEPITETRTEEPSMEEWIDEPIRNYVRREARRIAEEIVAPLMPAFQVVSMALYDNLATIRIQERLQQDKELQGLITEEDIQQIKRAAAERFNFDLDAAYDVYTAGLRRALQQLKTERPVREESEATLNGKLTPGERLRILAEQ